MTSIGREIETPNWQQFHREGQSGMRLVRRSVATLARKRLGEKNWIQGRIMLGHVQPTTSDIYAVSDPAHLGRALKVTQTLINEIEALAPGAFYRGLTARNNEVAETNAA